MSIRAEKKDKKKVEEIEKEIYKRMNDFMKDISANEIATYKNVMNKMEEYLEKKE